MDLITKLQEKYIEEFASSIPIAEFIFNIVIAASLAVLLRWFYVKYGTSFSNRRKFGSNFLPLTLGTLLIITVVKSSIALSLGLVGALSIVRFRSAIKEPEELTFLFLAIGIGLACGANQPILATIGLISVLVLLFFSAVLNKKEVFKKEDKVFVNIQTDITDLESITQILIEKVPFVELRRLDTSSGGLDLSFVCKIDHLDQVNHLTTSIRSLSPKTTLSIIDYPEL